MTDRRTHTCVPRLSHCRRRRFNNICACHCRLGGALQRIFLDLLLLAKRFSIPFCTVVIVVVVPFAYAQQSPGRPPAKR